MKKIIIKGELIIKTGLHIGSDDSFSAIGAIDSPIIRNSSTGKPIIPGSSLKGKIRSLLAKNMLGENVEIKDESNNLKRLFGSDEYRSRLIFSDLDVLEERLIYTEAKYENTINRRTGVANPRQIERVMPGVKFDFILIYNVIEEKDLAEDFLTLTQGLKLLVADYLGGGGTRGSGRILFNNLQAHSDKDYDLKDFNNQLKEVTEFGEKLYNKYENQIS